MRRIYKIREGSMICGVCTGLGAYLGIDPNAVRIGFVALSCLGGSGAIIYLVAALILPEKQ